MKIKRKELALNDDMIVNKMTQREYKMMMTTSNQITVRETIHFPTSRYMTVCLQS